MLTLAAGLLVLMSATGGGGASTESVGPEAPSPEPSRHLDRRRMGVFVTEAGGPSRRDFSLEGHTVPEALDELEAQYESLWENAELAYASEPAEIEWFITQWPYGASAREYPIGVVLLDEMACRMREGDLGPQRDRLIIRFLRDLDKHIRAPQEGLPSWELMHIISRTVCYPDPVEPGPHIDLAVNLFRELTTFHSEAVRLAACNELLTIGMFCSLERQRSLIALVKGRMSEVATPRNSFPCGDDLSWESLEWRMREYEYRSFPLAIVRTSFVSEARYREFPTATAEELLDAFAGGGPLGAEVYLATNTIVQNPEHRFALMTKGLEYARQHPKDCRTLVNCILGPTPKSAAPHQKQSSYEGILLATRILMEDGIPDDLDIFWGMGDERLFRTHISAVLHTMVTGLRWRVDYGVPPPDTRAFNGVTDYHGHEVLLEALLAYLEKPAPFEHRVRAATYLDIAFEDFPKTAQDVHPRLATLLPKLKEEYGMTGGKQDAETDEWCLVDLVEKQIDNAARTVRYGTETGFLKPNG